jgi:hypothetical protein
VPADQLGLRCREVRGPPVVGATHRRRSRGVEDLLDQVVGELVVALGDGE